MKKGGNTTLIIASMVSIFLIVSLLVGITFAYFQASITWSNNTPSITGAAPKNLSLKYSGSNSINCNACSPGWSDYLTFTVKNEGDGKANYNVVWATFNNNFTRRGDLRYTISCSASSGSCSGVSTSQELPQTLYSTSPLEIISNVPIGPGVSHNYTLYVYYVNANTTQDVDKNKTFSGKISITAASTKY